MTVENALWWLGRAVFVAALLGFLFRLHRALAAPGDRPGAGRSGLLTLEAIDPDAEVWVKERTGRERRLFPGAGVYLRGRVEIGRGPGNQVRVVDPFVSAKHCVVRQAGHRYVVADLGTTNGTRVNDRLVNGRAPLDPGTTIDVGRARFRFEVK